jgi:hypothetical protein
MEERLECENIQDRMDKRQRHTERFANDEDGRTEGRDGVLAGKPIEKVNKRGGENPRKKTAGGNHKRGKSRMLARKSEEAEGAWKGLIRTSVGVNDALCDFPGLIDPSKSSPQILWLLPKNTPSRNQTFSLVYRAFSVMTQKNSSTFAIDSISIEKSLQGLRASLELCLADEGNFRSKLPFGEFRRATMIDFFDRNCTSFVE